MTVNRKHFERFYLTLPSWTCPRCKQGHLLIDKKTLAEIETGPSSRARDHPDWDPDWIERRFAAILRCNLPSCGELAAIGGSVKPEIGHVRDYDGSWSQTVEDYFEPQTIYPPPLMIHWIDETPENVRECLRQAEGLIWINAEASANQVRQAVECLLDDRKIRKTTVTRKGKRARLTLHGRILEFEKKDPENSELLFAIKWLGNSGSHPGGLTRDNVCDALDMIELVLLNLYGQAAKSIRRKAKAINRAKGPAKAP